MNESLIDASKGLANKTLTGEGNLSVSASFGVYRLVLCINERAHLVRS